MVNVGGKDQTHKRSTVRTDDFELEGAAAATALIDRDTQVLALIAGAHVIHVARDALVSRQCDVTALVVSQVCDVHGVFVPEDICGGKKRLRFNIDAKNILWLTSVRVSYVLYDHCRTVLHDYTSIYPRECINNCLLKRSCTWACIPCGHMHYMYMHVCGHMQC